MLSLKKLGLGVLIIGSLFWDNANREIWRRKRVNMAAASRVRVPIRYGTLSTGRKRAGQYTMTLSNSAGLGTAFVIPCINSISRVEDLFEEARQLARAEGFQDPDRWPSWGAVGVMARDRDIASQIDDAWVRYFSASVDVNKRIQEACGAHESPQIDGYGFLNIEWPQNVHGGPSACDLLLATANEPTLRHGQYAAPAEIASSLVNQAHGADYFCRNVLSGVRTFEDVEIWDELRRLNPAWLHDEAYRQLSKALLANADATVD